MNKKEFDKVPLTDEETRQAGGGFGEDDGEFECRECRLSFITKAEYDNHMITYHSGGMKKYELA